MVKTSFITVFYVGGLKSNAHVLVERERNDLQKRTRWHVEVTHYNLSNVQHI
jgi:Uri superfamily endonuclease